MNLSALESAIESRSARLAVIGLGYVGLPVACEFARAGFDVLGVEIVAQRVARINAGHSPIEGHEPGLAELLAEIGGAGQAACHVGLCGPLRPGCGVDRCRDAGGCRQPAALCSVAFGVAEPWPRVKSGRPGDRRVDDCARHDARRGAAPAGAGHRPTAERGFFSGQLPGARDAGQAAGQPARREPRGGRHDTRNGRGDGGAVPAGGAGRAGPGRLPDSRTGQRRPRTPTGTCKLRLPTSWR